MASLYVIDQIGPEVAERDEKISELWGLEERTSTREQVQALLDGKKIYFDCMCEYMVAITMEADNEKTV